MYHEFLMPYVKLMSIVNKHLLVTKCDRFRCNEITNLTMTDIEDLGSAIVVKVQDPKNYKSRSFTILGKFYLEICRKYIR
jgi:hypothetical protein